MEIRSQEVVGGGRRRGVRIYLYKMGRKVIPLAINGMKKVKMKTIEGKNDGITGRGRGGREDR